MHLTTIIVTACAAWSIWLILYHIGRLVLALLQPVRQRLSRRSAAQPPISILIPIQRLEADLTTTLGSVYNQDYPEFEVLICSNGKSAGTMAAIERIARAYPQVPTRFVTATEQSGINPKVNNLAPAIELASHDLLLIKDSNVQLAPGELASLAGAMAPGVGMACVIPVAIDPIGFAADIEQAFMSGHAATNVLAGATLGANIGYGKVMMFRRRDFRDAGGLKVISDTFGDDHALAKAFARNGLKTVYTTSEAWQSLNRKTFREIWNRQLRWMVIRRDEAGIVFFAEPFFGGAVAITMAAIGAAAISIPWWLAAALVAAAWILPEMLALALRGWPMAWRYPLAMLCRDAMTWPLWISAWGTKRVQWDGHAHALAGTVRPQDE